LLVSPWLAAASPPVPLVRGGRFEDFDLRSLRAGIVAAGDLSFVYNDAGEIPETVIAPPLLLDDFTIEPAEQRSGHLPYYPPPPE
jgi:hypothetical protein